MSQQAAGAELPALTATASERHFRIGAAAVEAMIAAILSRTAASFKWRRSELVQATLNDCPVWSTMVPFAASLSTTVNDAQRFKFWFGPCATHFTIDSDKRGCLRDHCQCEGAFR
jgi:hypothetical protein